MVRASLSWLPCLFLLVCATTASYLLDPAEDPDEERLAAFVLLCVAAAGVVATMVALNGDTSSFAQMPELYLEGSDADILDFLGSGACEPGGVECKFR